MTSWGEILDPLMYKKDNPELKQFWSTLNRVMSQASDVIYLSHNKNN